MTRVFNDPAYFKDEMANGFVSAYCRYVEKVTGASGVMRVGYNKVIEACARSGPGTAGRADAGGTADGHQRPAGRGGPDSLGRARRGTRRGLGEHDLRHRPADPAR